MADVIKTIGSIGADYTTLAGFWSARDSNAGAGDVYIAELIEAVNYAWGEVTGAFVGTVKVRPATGVKLDLKNVAAAHASITSSTTSALFWRSDAQITIEDLELYTSFAATCLRTNGFEDTNVIVKNSLIRGGTSGISHSRSGGVTLVENCVVTEATTWGINNSAAGITIRNTVVVGNNTSNTASRGGVRKDIAGCVLENVVAYGNLRDDFYAPTTSSTISYLSSGDSSATGANAITGVTTAAFTNYAAKDYTAANGGVLDGTAGGGLDRGLNLTSADVIVITSPLDWVLFSRNKVTNTGTIAITGTYSGSTTPTSIEARWSGGSWSVIDAAPAAGTFSGSLTSQPSGNGTLEVRFSNATTITDSSDNIAIGAKILFWGQSNFSGRATNPQSFTGSSGFFHKYTVSNNVWQQGADPFDEDTASGSLFPLLATQLSDYIGVPVGFIGVAEGSTTLSQWQSGQTLNTRMLNYLSAGASNNVEAIASWIGEGDASAVTDETTFKTQYNSVIDQLHALTSTKSLLVAPSGLANADYANVRQWISDVAASNANAYDNEVQMWPLFQSIHYVNDTDTGLAAEAVFDGIISSFYESSVASSTITYDVGNFSFVAESNLAFQMVSNYDIGDFSVSVITDQSGVDIGSTINFGIGSFGFYALANNGASQQISATEIAQSSEISEIDVTSVAEFVYSEGMTLFIQNNGESTVSPIILGTDSGLLLVKGVGYVDLSGGFSVGSIDVGGIAAINLDTIRYWLRGTARLVDAAGCSVFILIK